MSGLLAAGRVPGIHRKPPAVAVASQSLPEQFVQTAIGEIRPNHFLRSDTRSCPNQSGFPGAPGGKVCLNLFDNKQDTPGASPSAHLSRYFLTTGFSDAEL
jgi:hypothetical protein